MELKEAYSIKELADFLGTSSYTIRRRIKDGSIIAYKVFGKYMVSSEEVDSYTRNLEKEKVAFQFFTNCGRIKIQFKNKELELYDDKEFKEEVFRLVYSGRRYDIRSDLARIYYIINEKEENRNGKDIK